MRALAAAFTVTIASAGCMREGAPPIAPVEVAVGEVGDAGATQIAVVPAPLPAARDRCSARLIPGAIATGGGCTLDERLSKESGRLLYPCSGTGAVEAVFSEHRFEGLMTDGSLIVNLTTEIDWDDGCHWKTKQQIRGELHSGTRGAKLVWTYSEGPVSGTGCFGSCKATADIDVEESPNGH